MIDIPDAMDIDVPPPELADATVEYADTSGLGPDPGVERLDPSNVLAIDGTYHVWYTRFPSEGSGAAGDGTHDAWETRDGTEIWHATSEGGREWTERGSVLAPSDPGDWDAVGKHAPHVVPAEGEYYLFYTAGGFETSRRIGIATSADPEGPFDRRDDPILAPATPDRAFDGMVVDDPCVIVRDGRYWLYYKGRSEYLRPYQTMIGVATADVVGGPYERSAENPLYDGHTGCVWPHREGVAAIADNAAHSVRYGADGLHFRPASPITPALDDAGVHCPDAFADVAYGGGIEWGLALVREPTDAGSRKHYITRFEASMAAPAPDDG